VEERVPESPVHLRIRTALFLVLERRLRGKAFVGSDQFVYYEPHNPLACLAPDAFVRLGGPSELVPTFRTWEHGAPHVGVEIVSPSDARDREHERRLERYRRSGIGEVVVFDADASEPLRIWDNVEGDLVERERSGAAWTRCDALGAYWFVTDEPRLGLVLRVADHADGAGLWLSPDELEAQERAAREAERAAHDTERLAQLARIAELEAELRRRG
jgi:Uma2 family endonuclease